MNYQSKRLRFFFMLVLGLCLAVTAVAAAGPTSASITGVLNKARVLTQSFTVSCAGNHCDVVTYRNPKASDNDMKIDAILTAKAIRDVYPSIQSVTVQFYETYNLHKIQYIEVHAGDVSAFSLGGLNKEQLLSSLPIHRPEGVGGSAAVVSRKVVDDYQVAPGFNKSGRTRMLADLQEIQSAGGDLSQLWPRFMEIEKVIREGGAEAITNDFNTMVPDVFKALRDAKLRSSQIEEQSRLRNAQIESEGKVGQVLPNLHPGFALLRRQRIAREIDKKARFGENVQYFQALLINAVEPLCRNNEQAKAIEQMALLERMMNLSPYTGPM